MSRQADPVRDLNNFLQGHSRGNLTHLLSWETTHSGPQHQVTHYATAKFQQREIGHGQGLSKGNAKAVAAAEALRYLQQTYPN
ncbi:hypothetical protein EDB83DRAFT_2523350 [Lactarius deliciosus]|nr:hypothetical protein EDB83DRAFT_2530233 [Lactarius deliciosus]KAH9046351.1 hypothetical protein EDB83DRAFT_2523350 [Lactarius deliciosus]